jgi:transposase InsO family protein
MATRNLIGEVAFAEGLNVSAFCREHGIGRDAFYVWRDRYRRDGPDGLESRSRAPKRVANRTPAEVEDAVVALRKELIDEGLDAGAESIHDQLAERLPAATKLPSAPTIYRILRRGGFIVAEPRKRPAPAVRRFAAERANECWQFDVTHWELADGTSVEIINGVDDCSRLAVACTVVTVATLANVWETVCDAMTRWGPPERLLTDNGTVFGAGLRTNLAALGIAIRHSRPYHPQTCGKVERFHQTLKQWLGAHEPPATTTDLQAICDAFIERYNHRRKHRALGRRTPHQVWVTTPKSGPAHQPLPLDPNQPRHAIYRVRVYDGVTWAAGSRITIGAAYNNRTATTIVTGLHAHVFIDGQLVRALTINPTRQHQPLYDRPGRQPK